MAKKSHSVCACFVYMEMDAGDCLLAEQACGYPVACGSSCGEVCSCQADESRYTQDAGGAIQRFT